MDFGCRLAPVTRAAKRQLAGGEYARVIQSAKAAGDDKREDRTPRRCCDGSDIFISSFDSAE